MALNIVKKLKNKIKVASESDLNELCEEVVKEVEESALILSIDERCEAFDYLILSAVKFYKGCDDSLARFLEKFAAEDCSRNGLTPWGDYSRGVVFWAKKEFLKADYFFKQSATYGIKRRYGATGCYSRVSLDTVKYLSYKNRFSLGYGEGLCDVEGKPLKNKEPSLGEGPVLMASSDSKYFLKFAHSFVKSAFEAEAKNVHLHVVNPDEECFELLVELQKKFGDVVFSYQNTSEFNFSPDKSFYACSRFLILPYLLEYYNSPMVVADIDVAISRDFNKKSSKLHFYDIGLRFSGIPVPWLNVTGACMYVSGSKASVDFCGFVSNYISLVYDMTWGRDNWVLDQNALFSSYEALVSGAFGEDVSVADLTLRNNKLVTPAQHLKGGKASFSVSI